MGRGGNQSILERPSNASKRGELIIMCGVPGSGKSTWVKHNSQAEMVNVSSDAIRLELFGSLRAAHQGDVHANNQQVFNIFYARIAAALAAGKTVIADSTNLRAANRKKLAKLAKQYNAATRLIVFKNIHRARENNVRRPEDQIVPKENMDAMIQTFNSSIHNLKHESYSSVEIID